MTWVRLRLRAAGRYRQSGRGVRCRSLGAKPLIRSISLRRPGALPSLISAIRSVTELVGSCIIGRTEQQSTRFWEK